MDQFPLWHVGRTKRGQLYSVLSAATWWSPDDDEKAVARLLSALQANKKYPTALVHVRSGAKSGFVDFSRWPAQDAVFCSCGSCGAGRKLTLREFEAHGRVPGEKVRSAWAFKMDIRLATYIWCTRYRGDVRGAALLEYVRKRYPGTRYPIMYVFCACVRDIIWWVLVGCIATAC